MMGKQICVLVLTCAIAIVGAPILFARASSSLDTVQDSARSAAQTPQGAATSAPITSADDSRLVKFVYDVVSIKPFKEDPKAPSGWMGGRDSEDGTELHNAWVRYMIVQAFRTEHSRVAGGPDWIDKDRFEVQAKMDPDVAEAFSKLSVRERVPVRQHMLQVLLADYFKVKVHMESEEIPVFQLLVAKGGLKMKENTDASVPDDGPMVRWDAGAQEWQARAMRIDTLAYQLSYWADRPIYNGTGLTGRYGVTLKFTPDNLTAPGAAPSGDALDQAPPLAKALEEQLGLKLVPAKGPRDVIVVDHVERPEPN